MTEYLETNFGNNGLVEYYLGEEGGSCIVTSSIIYPDGKILVSTFNRKFNDYDLTYFKSFLTKYNIDGSLDTTFGNQGIVEGNYAQSLQFFLNEDGSFFVLGFPAAYQGIPWTLSLYFENGKLDTTFGNNGIIDSETLAEDNNIEPDVNGNFIIETSGGIEFNNKILLGGNNLLVGLFNKNGTIDTTFGNNGFTRPDNYPTNDNTSGYVSSVISQNNKIISANQYRTYEISEGEIISETFEYFLARYDENGKIDKTFGNNGISKIIENNSLYFQIKLQSNNKIILASQDFKNNNYFIIYRFEQNGFLDTTFGENGIVKISCNNEFGYFNLEIAKNDYILISLSRYLYKFTENGFLDTSFGENGMIKLLLPINRVLTLYNDDSIILSGQNSNNAGITKYNINSNLKVNQNMIFEIWNYFLENPGFGFNLPYYDISGMNTIDYGTHRNNTNELLNIMYLYTTKKYKIPGLYPTITSQNYNSGISSINEFLADENL